MRKAILAALERYFGPEAGTPLDFVVKVTGSCPVFACVEFGCQCAPSSIPDCRISSQDWSLEKWSGGCPANFMTPGTLTNYGNCLKEPYQRYVVAGVDQISKVGVSRKDFQ